MKMIRVILLLSCICLSRATVHLSSVLSSLEQQEIKNFLEKTPYSDVSHAYHAVQGLSSLSQGGSASSEVKKAACDAAKSASAKSLESMFYATSIVFSLSSTCKHVFPENALDSIAKKISPESDTKQIFFAVSALANVGRKFSSEDALSALLSAIKEDDSVLSSSLALLTALKLDSKLDIKPLLDAADVEDMVNQGDEVDDKYLHFENDIRTTATFIRAAYEVAKRTKSLKMTEDQVMMLANFILRSKNPSTHEQAYNVVGALGAIAAYPGMKVAKVQLLSGNTVSQENSAVKVSVTNVFNQPLEGVTVKVDSVTRSSDDEVIISNVPLKKSVTAAVTLYELNMWDLKPKSGFYDITLNVVPTSGNKVAGISELEFRVKVTTKIAILDAQFGAEERESTATGNLQKVSFPSKGQSIKVDSQQKIVMTFKVQDTMDSTLIKPHQVFVLFQNVKSGQEIIFIAESDAQSAFKFEVDMHTAGKDQFSNIGGQYTMHLILGDAAISNPVLWHVADVTLSIGSTEAPKSESIYDKKPEIRHLFREPEKRPPAVISTLFTFACLAPLLVLVVSWLRTGLNLGNLSLSPANILFHAGLGGIFFLYYMFWTQLNMFTTIRYLVMIGSVTFLAGNKVLANRDQQ